MALPRTLRALRHRNYRLFFAGQGTSLIGTWITRIATSWLVYRLTGSELLLGLTGFCGQIPMLVLGPFAGVLCDRFNKHRILLVTQTLSLLQSALLAWLAFSGRITVAHVLGLQLFQGLINTFDMPARQALVPRMIEDPKDLSNAIALNSSMVNGSRILGPTVGGLLLASLSEAWCFALDAVSYLFVLLSLLLMRLHSVQPARTGKPVLEELREGVAYVWNFAPVRTLLVQLGILGLVSMPYTVLMPVIATSVLHGGPNTLGLLMTAQGCGALLGALYLASRESVLGLSRVMMMATAAFGFGLVGFALSSYLYASMLILMLANGGFMLLLASTNTILQTLVDDELRGRVMSFYAMAMLGTAPIGSLLGGALAEHLGAPETIIIGGVCAVATGLWFALQRNRLREMVRPIYIQRGILPAPEVVAQASAGSA